MVYDPLYSSNNGTQFANIINRKESSLIPTLRSENLADVSTECFSLHQGESLYQTTLLSVYAGAN